jgi:hypothetical protein
MKCAIVIGVNKVGNLTRLTAAVDGAKQFKAWAASQGYQVFEHYDTENPVTYQNIRDDVNTIVRSRKCERLIIFFSGHGKWQGPGTEKWLLSNAAEEPTEAINLNPSAFAAQGSGIEHLVFISDACRSVVIDPKISYVNGASLFSGGDSDIDTHVDIIYSTQAGDLSYEVRSPQDGETAFGVFTKCLLRGLEGNVSNILTPFPDKDNIQKNVVESIHLYKYLKDAVQEELFKINKLIKQRPQSQIVSRLPQYLAEFPLPTAANDDPTNGQMVKEDPIKFYPKDPTVFIEQPLNLDDRLEYSMMSELFGDTLGVETQEYYRFKAKTHELLGTQDLHQASIIVYVSESSVETSSLSELPNLALANDINSYNQLSIPKAAFAEPKLFQVLKNPRTRLKTDRYFLPIGNGNILPIPLLDDFISTVWIKNGKIVHLSFQPNRNTSKFDGYNDRRSQLDKRALLILAAAHAGVSNIFPISGGGELLGNYLRRGKSYDPILGVYATYAYAQAGRWEDIVSVYRYMERDVEPVMYDVQLFADLLNARIANERDEPTFNKSIPILTQGWSYLTEKQTSKRPDLQQLGKYLVPGLWSTFTAEATELLLHNKKKGKK